MLQIRSKTTKITTAAITKAPHQVLFQREIPYTSNPITKHTLLLIEAHACVPVLRKLTILLLPDPTFEPNTQSALTLTRDRVYNLAKIKIRNRSAHAVPDPQSRKGGDLL